MVKVFVSCPMQGLSSEEIEEVRKKSFERAIKLCPEFNFCGKDDFVLIDSYFKDYKPEAKDEDSYALKYLAKALDLLADADIVYFASDPEQSRGCKIEYDCALAYGKTLIVNYDKSFVIHGKHGGQSLPKEK